LNWAWVKQYIKLPYSNKPKLRKAYPKEEFQPKESFNQKRVSTKREFQPKESFHSPEYVVFSPYSLDWTERTWVIK
jgi:hypothetical protein